MTDAEMYLLIEEFANNDSIAIGGDIEVHVSSFGKNFTPRKGSGIKYEDVQLLSEIVRGAEHFLFWCRRNGYEVRK